MGIYARKVNNFECWESGFLANYVENRTDISKII